ncbi:MFS general substrate transporter [Periconia macrospinosa]|uniref:MFS general substrate transporter n=1 Tax=Periconia macrospinosa TaxID=97972 RepID=A0A2V1D5K1_9PLEO|nr:MFS general substrate transporter [Periconia macrospinosa]
MAIPGKGEEEFIVDWDGPDDETRPCNWPRGKRWANIMVVAVLGLLPNLATTMVAPGLQGVLKEFDVHSSTLSSLAVTIFLLGLALGPMFLAPLGEVFGRLPVYHAANIFFTAFMVGNALSTDISGFMIFRFLSGCAGGMPLNMGGGSIADLTLPADRGLATALFSLGPLAGPVLGPVVGGFLAASKGWRWTSWLLVILGKTSPKMLLERKAARLRVSTGNMQLQSKLAHKLSPKQVLMQAVVRPTMLLIRSPVYGFSASVSGLPWLGLGIALVLGVVVFGKANPPIQAARMRRDGIDTPKPEYRLLLMICLSPCVAVGLFIYGWTTYYRVHWIVPIIGTFFIGFGANFVLMPTQLYLIELFGSKGAASALSTNNVLRYMGGTFFPLAGPRLYSSLGYGWGNSLLGFLALLLVLPPVLLYRYGERLRAREAAGGE